MASVSPITYRLARYSDLDQIANVASQSFSKDPLFGIFYPFERRPQYPNAFHAFWYKRMRKRLLQARSVLVVAEMLDENSGKKTIVGFAHWEKLGKRSDTEDLVDGILLRCESKLVALQDYITSWITPQDPSLDKAALDRFIQMCIHQEEVTWNAHPRYDHRWHLQIVGVHSEARRRGAGKELVRWGMKWAEEDGVDAGLEASPMGMPVYLSLGWEILQVASFENAPDGAVMAWNNPNAKDA